VKSLRRDLKSEQDKHAAARRIHAEEQERARMASKAAMDRALADAQEKSDARIEAETRKVA